MFPVPQVNDDNRAFWTGGRDGELRIVRCNDDGYYIHPPRRAVPAALARTSSRTRSADAATCTAYTVNDRAWSPGLEVPYVIAIVELEEQSDLRLMTNIVGCSPAEVRIGLPVRWSFVEQGDAFAPVFRPTQASRQAPPTNRLDDHG